MNFTFYKKWTSITRCIFFALLNQPCLQDPHKVFFFFFENLSSLKCPFWVIHGIDVVHAKIPAGRTAGLVTTKPVVILLGLSRPLRTADFDQLWLEHINANAVTPHLSDLLQSFGICGQLWPVMTGASTISNHDGEPSNSVPVWNRDLMLLSHN